MKNLKKTTLAFLFIFALLAFTACSRRVAPSGNTPPPVSVISAQESQTPPEESLPPVEFIPEEPKIDAPPADLLTPGLITVYKYHDSGIYEPSEHSLSSEKDPTLLDIVRAVEADLDMSFPIISITQRKGFVEINIAERFIQDYSKAKCYTFLHTLAATLRENHRSFEWLQYQSNGVVGIYGEQWKIPPLRLVEGKPEDFTALRAQIPYEGLEVRYISESVIDTDETGRKIIEYLTRLPVFFNDISSISELDNPWILHILLENTKPYFSSPDNPDYRPELRPFSAPASEIVGFREDMFWLKEHVEATARLLFGDDYSVKHESFSKYLYMEHLGVYTPPHVGVGSYTLPVLLSYEEIDGGYKAEVAYFSDSMGGIMDSDAENWDTPLEIEEIKDYALTKSKRSEVILKKAEDGRLLFVRHRYL